MEWASGGSTIHSNDYTGVERFECGCIIYLKETKDEEIVVRIVECEFHKDSKQIVSDNVFE